MAKKAARKYVYNQRTWKLDCWLALHLKLCWALCAILTIGGYALIVCFLPIDTAFYCCCFVLGLAVGLGYQWANASHVRAVHGWMDHRKDSPEDLRAAFSYVELLEKKLPVMERKASAIMLVSARAILMFELGQQQEAIDLIENFDQLWDESQKEDARRLIQSFKDQMNTVPKKEEENS